MKIATAIYDRYGTLVMPDVFRHEKFYDSDLTLDAGYYHRYRRAFSTAHERLLHFLEVEKWLERSNATPLRARCSSYTNRAGETRYTIDIIYLVETADRIPFWLKDDAEVDEEFVMPYDPVAHAGHMIEEVQAHV